MTVRIIDVKIVGLCSKHRGNEEPSKDKHGRVYEDKELCCLGCEL